MPKTYRPPYDKTHFENKTALLVELIARTVLDEKTKEGNKPEPDQVEYFVTHSDLWVRWFYANDQTWKRAIDSHKNNGNYGRDYVYRFVGHWADAFLKNPADYIAKHPKDKLDDH